MSHKPARGVRLALSLGAAVAFGGALTSTAAARADCGSTPGLVCSQVAVPLDRSGQVPGSIQLHVEVLPASGIPRGVMFLVAGGPGQGSAHTFALGSVQNAAFYRFLFPGYTLVAYDDRGTGDSAPIDCPGLQGAVSSAADTQLGADCAATLGPGRNFYSTADHAEDLDAVRQALGFDRIGIWGVSYGTKLALAYARVHPSHVERLLLDSVVAPERDDSFGTGMLEAMPATLGAYCAGGACGAATPDFAGDVAAEANALARNPLRGHVFEPDGRQKAVELDAVDFLGLVVDADLSPGLAAELPAAVHAARTGQPQPLLHAFQLDDASEGGSVADFSFALYLATVCQDGPFPWSPATPIADRQQLVDAALGSLPPGAFGPFGSWAGGIGNADLCLDWPTWAGGGATGTGALPDVPVLALSGGLDLRTPTAGAASVVAQFPQGHLLVVPGVGHSVVTADPSGCSQGAVRSWMQGETPPAACARAKSFLQPLASFPSVPEGRLDAARTLAVATRTVREAEAAWFTTATSSGSQSAVAGVDGGKLSPAAKHFVLDRYSIAPGVTVSGRVTVTRFGPPLTFTGSVTVGGKAAAHGTLRLTPTGLRGRLRR